VKKTHVLKRDLEPFIAKDLERKMVFVGGPRQSGKTTLAKRFLARQERYLSWDSDEDREKIIKGLFPSKSGIVVLDEIHKYTRWRNLLKGIFDKRGKELQIIVTGSAKLDYYRRGGDSLQGRYHYYRLHPITMMELASFTQTTLDALLHYSGFPEPFFLASEDQTRRWNREYRTRLIKEELQDLEKVNEISLIERLAIRLPDLVGSPLSVNAIREDLQVAHTTAARWVDIFERLYSIFRVYPFGSDVVRAVKKEAKHYHFNWTFVEDHGYRFENLVACHLLKWCHFIEDTQGYDMELRYFRDTDKREVDFVILKQSRPIYFVEAKLAGQEVSLPLRYLSQRFPNVPAIQVCYQKGIDLKDRSGIRICSATEFFRELKETIERSSHI